MVSRVSTGRVCSPLASSHAPRNLARAAHVQGTPRLRPPNRPEQPSAPFPRTTAPPVAGVRLGEAKPRRCAEPLGSSGRSGRFGSPRSWDGDDKESSRLFGALPTGRQGFLKLLDLDRAIRIRADTRIAQSTRPVASPPVERQAAQDFFDQPFEYLALILG